MNLQPNLARWCGQRFVFIEHHLGLGDHLICNGLYRQVARKHTLCFLVVSWHNRDSVRRMLKDVKNILVLAAPSVDALVFQSNVRRVFELLGCAIVRLGFFGTGFLEKSSSMKFDENFYLQAGIDFQMRWSSFAVTRNAKRELWVCDQYGVVPGKYIFLHEDRGRGYTIDRSRVRKDLPIVTPRDDGSISFFDYLLLIELSGEIHCIESSFAALIESLEVAQPKFAHRYARPEALKNPRYEPTYRPGWAVLID